MSTAPDGHRHLFANGICASCNEPQPIPDKGPCRGCSADGELCAETTDAGGDACCVGCAASHGRTHEGPS